mmetsp:Transcript_32765/g.37542  ORF Transcript_32765/g.37542 Transcript_32765/m.37542 type:complete len:87 (+) Transcript_32765:91-351(+)
MHCNRTFKNAGTISHKDAEVANLWKKGIYNSTNRAKLKVEYKTVPIWNHNLIETHRTKIVDKMLILSMGTDGTSNSKIRIIMTLLH